MMFEVNDDEALACDLVARCVPFLATQMYRLWSAG